MRIVFGLLFACSFGNSLAQKILYTSQDIAKPYTGRPIKAIRPGWFFGSKPTIIYQDGVKQKVDRDSIWGFEDSNHSLYRCYKGAWYQVDSLADLIRYTEVTTRFHLRHFSKGLDSPLYDTKRAARADTMRIQH